MNRRELRKSLKALIPGMTVVKAAHGEEARRSVYLGCYMDLDPCGRYHHFLSPNGATRRCEAFWERLNDTAEELGGWIEAGEGDPTDIYFSLPVETMEETREN